MGFWGFGVNNNHTFKLQFLFFISLWLFYQQSCRLSPESTRSYYSLDFCSSINDPESKILEVVLGLETWNLSLKIENWGSWVASLATNLAVAPTKSPTNFVKFQE